LSLEIVHTYRSSIPVVKTFEIDAYSDSKKRFVKSIRFYHDDPENPVKIKTNYGLIDDKYNTWDTSILIMGNYIAFYEREESCFKLMVYDLMSQKKQEMAGF
jgi:hypothetical protein